MHTKVRPRKYILFLFWAYSKCIKIFWASLYLPFQQFQVSTNFLPEDCRLLDGIDSTEILSQSQSSASMEFSISLFWLSHFVWFGLVFRFLKNEPFLSCGIFPFLTLLTRYRQSEFARFFELCFGHSK